VTNFSLGIETEGRRFSKLIPKGTHIPTQRTQLVSTVSDNQTTVRIHVLQGEHDLARDNVSLGDFELQGVPPGPRGSATIQVKFSIDSNGIVNVSAKETSSGVAKKITIKAPTSLNEAQLESLRDEANSFEAEERTRKHIDATKDDLKELLAGTEKWVMANAETIGAAGLGDIEGTLNHFRQALQNLQTAEESESLRNTIEDWVARLKSQ